MRIFDSMSNMKMSLDTKVEAKDLDDFVHTKEVFGDKWELFTKTSLSISN